MPGRLVDGAAASVERLRAGLSGPTLNEMPQASNGDHEHDDATVQAPYEFDYSTVPGADGERERYDEDYEYYWGDIRLPLWIALIWQVPWRQRLDIFIAGFIIGMVVAGIALVWGFVLSQY
ncbi:MAG TPA: hypothetical protein VHZ31_00730 [Solirubrobacteraceae bacterium]|jgi:hypothetical protein|nr:hypothetical protein [Solirubrobacteraceae bacterium]